MTVWVLAYSDDLISIHRTKAGAEVALARQSESNKAVYGHDSIYLCVEEVEVQE